MLIFSIRWIHDIVVHLKSNFFVQCNKQKNQISNNEMQILRGKQVMS